MEEKMAQQNTNGTQQVVIRRITMLDLFVVLAKQRKFIAKITAIFVVLGVAYALLATPMYKSEIQIMSPLLGKSSSGMSDIVAAAGLGDMGGSTSEAIVAITKSNIVLDKVIDDNNLMNREPTGLRKLMASIFPPKNDKTPVGRRTLIRSNLANNINSASDKKSGMISVSVTDTSPDMAMALVQSIFDETQRALQQVAVTPAAQQRVFLEQQLRESHKELADAEQKLIAFQSKTGIMSTASMPMATLQAQMTAKEIELRAAQRYGTSDNPRVMRLQAEYNALRSQFQANSSKVGTTPMSGFGIKKAPQAAAEYESLMREFKFRESLEQILLRQYESAKINEANDPVVIQLLSPPTVPEFKDSPKRKKIVVQTFVLGLFLGVFLALVRNNIYSSSQDPDEAPKIAFLKEVLAEDCKFFTRKK